MRGVWRDGNSLRESDMALSLTVFPLIRKYAKFCSRCGKKMDLTFPDFHMPFCMKCRQDLVDEQRREMLNHAGLEGWDK